MTHQQRAQLASLQSNYERAWRKYLREVEVFQSIQRERKEIGVNLEKLGEGVQRARSDYRAARNALAAFMLHCDAESRLSRDSEPEDFALAASGRF